MVPTLGGAPGQCARSDPGGTPSPSRPLPAVAGGPAVGHTPADSSRRRAHATKDRSPTASRPRPAQSPLVAERPLRLFGVTRLPPRPPDEGGVDTTGRRTRSTNPVPGSRPTWHLLRHHHRESSGTKVRPSTRSRPTWVQRPVPIGLVSPGGAAPFTHPDAATGDDHTRSLHDNADTARFREVGPRALDPTQRFDNATSALVFDLRLPRATRRIPPPAAGRSAVTRPAFSGAASWSRAPDLP